MKRYLAYGIMVVFALLLAACAKNSGLNQRANALMNGDFSNAFGSSTQTAPITEPSGTHIMFNNMNNYFRHGRSANVDGVEIDTFVPAHESVDHWTQRIEITSTKVSPNMTPAGYYSQVIKADYREQCYGASSKIHELERTANSLMYKYSMKNCGKMADQTVVGKIFKTNDSISTISYTTKGDSVAPEVQSQMTHLVQQAVPTH